MEEKTSFFRRKLSSQGLRLYDTLEIEKDADLDKIKDSYRKLAKIYHPDKSLGDNDAKEKFKDISYAYTVLTDSQKRKIYDAYGSIGLDIFSQIGEEKAEIVLKMQNSIVKALVLVGCLLTGCCYCYCCYCLCCYNFCFGLCKPSTSVDDSLSENTELLQMKTNADGNNPITEISLSATPSFYNPNDDDDSRDPYDSL